MLCPILSILRDKEYFCSGVGKFLDGKYEEAQKKFQEALTYDASLPLAYCYLGIISTKEALRITRMLL